MVDDQRISSGSLTLIAKHFKLDGFVTGRDADLTIQLERNDSHNEVIEKYNVSANGIMRRNMEPQEFLKKGKLVEQKKEKSINLMGRHFRY